MSPRLFIAPGVLAGQRLLLAGDDARRAFEAGAVSGGTLWVLDGSGWAYEVRLESVGPKRCGGTVIGRRLCQERRTQVTLQHGMMPSQETRQLVQAATSAGVVALGALITDHAMVPGPEDDHPENRALLAAAARAAAEASTRGRMPRLLETCLFDSAIDEAGRSGETTLVVASGDPRATAALDARPFTIRLLCPPAGGFSAAEIERALRSGAHLLDPPHRPSSSSHESVDAESMSAKSGRIAPVTSSMDRQSQGGDEPIANALAALAGIYDSLEATFP